MKKDITDKLNFNGNPFLIINGVEIEVSSDATTMIKLMGLIGDDSKVTPNAIVKMYNMLFADKERKKIENLKLNMEDFQTLVMAAIEMLTGESEQSGEQ